MSKLVLVVAVLRCALAASDVTVPPNATKPLMIGFVEGFISDKPDIMTCGMAAASEVAELKEALADLKTAFKSFNLTGIEIALNETASALLNIPEEKAACRPVKADLTALITALRKGHHGPKHFIERILDNLVQDGEKIFDELAAGDKAYKTGWDYMTAGQNLGMATRRMLVGEMNGTTPPGPVIPGCSEAIVIGFATGFISDSPRLLNCSKALKTDLADFSRAAKNLAEGLLHMNWTAVAGAVDDFADAIQEAQDSVPTCKTSLKITFSDIKAIIAGLRHVHGPKDLVIHMMDNIFSDGENIFGELARATEFHKNKDCPDAGHYMGMAFRRILVGEAKPKPTTFIV